LTLRDGEAGVALAWMQHRDYTWEKVQADEPREPIQAVYRLGGMSPGRYVAEIWDPLTGAVLGEELLRVGEDGILIFDLLPIDRQLAIRVLRQDDRPETDPTEAPSLPFVASTNTPLVPTTPVP
jgi:hypothetical protein